MRRTKSKVKRRPVVLFPTEPEMEMTSPESIGMGDLIRIGKPSSRYYQYIHHSVDFLSHKLTDLSELLDLKGATVRVTGMIRLKGGSRFAIAEPENTGDFPQNKRRLFVEVTRALQNREVIVE